MLNSRIYLLFLVCGIASAREGYGPGEQDWGFVTVRPGAHMFYWLYYTTAADIGNYTARPLVIWLQGGPGASSTGFGNFEQFGPLDIEGKPRNSSWVQHVNLLLIDSPVGAGYSFVDDDNTGRQKNRLSSHQIALDLVQFMKKFYALHAGFVNTPLHIFSESYGGKMATEFALELYNAIERRELSSNLLTVSVGNPWVSPVDTINSYAPFLLHVGLIDHVEYAKITAFAKIFETEANAANWRGAFTASLEVLDLIDNITAGINFYNIQKPSDADDDAGYGYSKKLKELMQGDVAKKLNVSGNGHNWGAVRDIACGHLEEDEGQSSVHIVRQLLNDTPIKVAFYSGQLDLICATPGTITWIEHMQWHNKSSYMTAPRTPIKIDKVVQGYEKSGGRLSMFWVNFAGHMVQQDNPTAMTYILKKVTNLA